MITQVQPQIDTEAIITHILSSFPVRSIQSHSEKVHPGDLFVAITGTESDGHRYIQRAIERGAMVIIGEKEMPSLPVPYFRVPHARPALARIAAHFYEHPDQRHSLIGITGTNGKTTTAYMLKHILEHAGLHCSLFGTIEHIVNGQKYPSKNTTPDPLQLHKWLAESEDDVVIMEVSSHGIDQDRIHGLTFNQASFTNLSHDHLDYHQHMDEYFETKARLFEQIRPQGVSFINTLSPWGKKLATKLHKTGLALQTIGKRESDHVRLVDIKHDWCPTFTIQEQSETQTMWLPFPGEHNVWNALLAYTNARQLGLDPQLIREALASFPGVPGRLETYTNHHGAFFIVDYAHTPDGITQSLRTLRQCGAKRVTHIFGFRGNRDISKRDEMLNISQEWSDEIVLTTDDLNQVKAEQMSDEVHALKEAYGGKNCMYVEDRTQAIQQAWNQAGPGEYVIITGKGPERYQHSFSLPTQSDCETIQFLMQRTREVAGDE